MGVLGVGVGVGVAVWVWVWVAWLGDVWGDVWMGSVGAWMWCGCGNRPAPCPTLLSPPVSPQRGAVLGTEIKHNGFKVARWTAQALLGGIDRFSLGYVSRRTASNRDAHELLSVISLVSGYGNRVC